jgi:hypothetical protein
MRSLALFAIVLLVSCASSSQGIVDERLRDCESGGDISVIVGFDNLPVGEGLGEDRFDLLVEVSNNSHAEVTVTGIRVDQQHASSARYRIDGVRQKFDDAIEEGKDRTFRLPVVGRRVLSQDRSSSVLGSSGLELVVTVTLSNGDSYRCLFVQNAG